MINYAEEIRNRLQAREVLEFYGMEINRAGFCRCPFHEGDNTGSLKVYNGTKGWHCFGCGAGTSVLDFVMRYFGLSFFDAEKKLNEDFRLGLPIGDRLSREQWEEAERRSAERRRKQKEREIEHDRLQMAYDDALSRWIWLDTIRDKLAPKSPQNGFKDAYVFAVTWIDSVSAELDEATDRLMEFERSKK